MDRPQTQPPTRPVPVSSSQISGSRSSALSNLQAIASGQRGGQGLPDGSRVDAFSRSLPSSQGPRSKPQSRPQPPRRQPPTPQLAEDIRTNSIPQGPVRSGANPDNALAALFKVAKSASNGSTKSGRAQAVSPQVLNDRAASRVIPKGRSRANNKQIISNERSLNRGRGGIVRGRGSADAIIQAGVGRKNSASQAAARTGLRSSAAQQEAQTGQHLSAGNAAPARPSNPSQRVQLAARPSAQFEETLAQFGFQPRLLSGQQPKSSSLQNLPPKKAAAAASSSEQADADVRER